MTPNQELDELLAQEIDRRLGVTGDGVTTEALRTVFHLLKGSASMAGHHDLALLVTQLSARLHASEAGLEALATSTLRQVSKRLKLGLTPFDSSWPEPPHALRPSEIPQDQRGEYVMTMRDRLRELDSVISRGFGDIEQLSGACRVVHSMKATAASVGDGTTAWYCHHLEAKLRQPAPGLGTGLKLFSELEGHRATLSRLLDSPEEAFAMLRAHRTQFRTSRKTTPPPFRLGEGSVGRASAVPFTTRSSTLPPGETLDADPDATLRIPTTALDEMFDHVERIDIWSNQSLETATLARKLAKSLLDLRHQLSDAQCLVGGSGVAGTQAKVHGALAQAMGTIAHSLSTAYRVEQDSRTFAELLRTEWYDTRRSLGRLRRTTLAQVFGRCERAAYRYAESEGKSVEVEILGGEWSVDRVLSERLLEPLLQIAKNAICHGIEAPEVRERCHKSPKGKLRFSAERHGEWIRLIVEDDGAGVDLERVRERAVDQGLLSEEESRLLGENELLSLLFVPGLSTRSTANMMAGRGIGLDLSQDVIRRMGGGIRFSVREPCGVRVTLELPQELGLMDVVWVTSCGKRFAIPVTFTGQVRGTNEGVDAPALLSCLGVAQASPFKLLLELVIPGLRPLMLGIDELGACEEVTVRSLPTRLAKTGPYLGAVLTSEGRLALVLDAPLLAARAWIHAA